MPRPDILRIHFFRAFAQMPPKESADLLIEARWVLPIAPVNTVLEDHAVAVTSGRIVALGPSAQLRARFEPREHVTRTDHALLPGFVNAHTRAAMALLRGLPVQGPRMRWLRETVFPAEQRCMSPDFVRDGTQIAIAEMLRAGITSFADMYFFPEEAARAAGAARMRAAIGLPVADEPTPWAESATAHLAKAERLWDEYKSDPWVCLYFAPDAPYAVSDSTLARVRRVADELDARVAMHAHETEVEVHDSLSRHGRRPLQRLHDLGLLRPGFTAVHMNRLDEEDMEIVTRTGICVVACPQSNLRLGSGSCPAAELNARHVAVGFGTDSPACSGAFDLLAESRAATLTANAGGNGTRRELGSEAVLRMATLGGATALGLSSLVGSIEPGKAADLICFDLATLACQPPERPADTIVFAATRQQASDVWTSGRAAVSGGHLLVFDEQELLALARQWAGRTRTGVEA
jgi:5-methylthioadenosine/S-adenosylhomocysteine deaminase